MKRIPGPYDDDGLCLGGDEPGLQSAYNSLRLGRLFPPINRIRISVFRVNDNELIDSFDDIQQAIDYLEDLQSKEYNRGNLNPPKGEKA